MNEEVAEPEHTVSGALHFLGNYEIRTLLGVSRQRMYQIAYVEKFPEPVAQLASGGVWLATDVDEWLSVRRPHLRQALKELLEALGPMGLRARRDEVSNGHP